MGTIAFVATFLFASLLIRDPVHPAPVTQPPVQELVVAPPEPKKPPEPPKPVKRGPLAGPVTVRDENLEFTVTALKSAVPKVDIAFMANKAEGSFTLIEVTIKNIGKHWELFIPAYAVGTDSRNHEVPADVSATIIANFGNDRWLQTIKPGQNVWMSIVFDVADGYELESLSLRGSVFSAGATVQL
jgi:Domain of unknown function (DUF4352)